MPIDIIINFTPFETRIAFLENSRVIKVLIERQSERGIVGNIYKGKIVKVLPGMQSCFVDIGLEKAAFLYVDDIISDFKEDDIAIDIEDLPRGKEEVFTPPTQKGGNVHISDLVKEGEEILVQVLKDPIGTKGARVTTRISLAGRFLVYMPTVDHIGVSRRIESSKERERLKELIETLKSKRGGYIVRTLAEDVNKTAIKADMVFLDRLWKEIKGRTDKAPVGKVIFYELDLILKTVRDYFSHDINKLIIDDRSEYKKILKFIESFSPKLKQAISLYSGDDSIFDAYSVENALGRALSRKVWLKSGGYIVIDQTEALTAIDVNSGRYVGHRNLEDTIFKINLEAISEIVDQIQIRNIGGIIIIDFIDMEKEPNRDKVFNVLKETITRDKAKTNILNFSEFGLVQMTRQRVSRNIREIMGASCQYCDGRGFIKSIETIAYEVLREIKREIFTAVTEGVLEGDAILIYTNPEVAKFMYEKMNSILEEYEKKEKIKIIFESNDEFHIEQFEVYHQINTDD